MEKFIVIVDQELITIEAQNYKELKTFMNLKEETFISFPYKALETCSKFKIMDNEMYENKEEEPKTNEIKGRYPLKKMTYSIHKKNKEEILKASYNFKSEKGWVWASKYLCFDRTGYAKEKALEWLGVRTNDEDYYKIDSTKTAYDMREYFETPIAIEVQMNDAGYPEIINEIW